MNVLSQLSNCNILQARNAKLINGPQLPICAHQVNGLQKSQSPYCGSHVHTLESESTAESLNGQGLYDKAFTMLN